MTGARVSVTTCELVGPPAAGKSTLAGRLRAIGHHVVDEQLQERRAQLGPTPTTPPELLSHQMRLVRLVLDAIDPGVPVQVVDVGVLSAVAFGIARLPPAMAHRLVEFAITQSRRAGVRLAAVCVVDAEPEELRRRAALDPRERSSLDANLDIAPRITAVLDALRLADPDGVQVVRTDGDLDVPALSRWIDARAGATSDCLLTLRRTRTGRSAP